MGGDKGWLNSDESATYKGVRNCIFTVNKHIKCLGLGVHMKKKNLTKYRNPKHQKVSLRRAREGTEISKGKNNKETTITKPTLCNKKNVIYHYLLYLNTQTKINPKGSKYSVQNYIDIRHMSNMSYIRHKMPKIKKIKHMQVMTSYFQLNRFNLVAMLH